MKLLVQGVRKRLCLVFVPAVEEPYIHFSRYVNSYIDQAFFKSICLVVADLKAKSGVASETALLLFFNNVLTK